MEKKEFLEQLNRLKDEREYSAYSAVSNCFENITSEQSGLLELKIAILRNFTIDPLVPVIKGEVALAGFHPSVYLGDYDTIAQDVLNINSEFYGFQPEVIILSQWLDTLAPSLIERFASFSEEQINDEIKRILDSTCDFVQAIRENTQAPILINNFSLPKNLTLGIMDAQGKSSQLQAILKLNQGMKDRLRQISNLYWVDYLHLIARVGAERAIDERYWHIGRAPIGRDALIPLGQEYGKFIRALKGKTKKCLLLDCDNVLWGGIIGEDGMEGIKLGESSPGSCYQDFQKEILNLHDRGVILALCSKNNEEDVLEVLKSHPGRVLRRGNFATWQINWEDKATNIMRIAEELNIGLDSMVFVDDSPFECNLVRESLPQVEVLELSSDPSTFKSRLMEKGYFDTLTFSEEDRKRTQMYKDQSERKKLLQSAASLEDYLTKLNMSVEIGSADEMTRPRITQLTQKTNQFNLTTKRYTDGDVYTFSESSESDVFYIKLRDKVAEMGLIGVAILKYEESTAQIDTFLLSCRAIGRGVEDALLAHVLNCAKAKGCQKAVGSYRETQKNGQVKDFYAKQGFRLLKETEEGSDWEIALCDRDFSAPSWITINTAGAKEIK